jgi:regulator of protease activity HflC (stomatin/prohibitin superfamily)
MIRLHAVLLTFIASVFLLATGCTPHSTGSTEVGVRIAKLGVFQAKGVVPDAYPPGTTSFFPPIINDWFVYDTALQNLVMSRELGTGARDGDDSLQFKTVDGNDISVNVTVAWTVDPSKIGYLVQFVGSDTNQIGDRLVRPVARTIVRDVLNDLASEQYYDANLRFQKAEEAAQLLNHYLNREGVLVTQVLLGEHRFNERYEQIIRDKKVAEQDAARLNSETEAAREQMRRELEVAKGRVSRSVEEALGEAQKREINADAIFFERQTQAEAIVTERRAKAEGISEQARALAGSGGRSLVKLAVARSLKGKSIVFVPTGGMDLRTTDMNALLQTYGVVNSTTGVSPTK